MGKVAPTAITSAGLGMRSAQIALGVRPRSVPEWLGWSATSFSFHRSAAAHRAGATFARRELSAFPGATNPAIHQLGRDA
jgi:hypothetical protein